MWVAQYSFDASKALIGGLAVKNKVSLCVFPFYVQERGDEVRVSFFITFRHDRPENFLRDLKKAKSMVFCNSRGSVAFGQLIEPLMHNVFYDPEVTHFKPWVVDGATGVETFTVASRKRKCLTRIAEAIKVKHLGKMDYIRWRDVAEFFILNAVPNVTPQQRKAFDLAVEKGYYDFPRRTNFRQLAKMMKVSYSTFQAHIQKAEKKLMPCLLKDTH
jgi:predicted DNA binding protein